MVEFVGCLAALGGGLALGLTYLGFDIKSMAEEALQQSEVVENSDFSETTSSTAEATEETAQPSTSNQTELQTVVAENDSAKKPISNTDSPVLSPEIDPEIATKIYWIALTDSMGVEIAQRKEGGATSGDWRLFDLLMHRKTGHEQAVASFEKLDDTSVDQRLVAHAHQVLSWHRAGAKLYSRAVELLTDSPSRSLDGPFAQSWQSAATQLRMEEKLVREKHLGVAGYLSHTYKSQTPFSPAISP